MAFSFGFYNALNHDRLYDAKSISRIFDGLITDGIYSEVGDRFTVKPAGVNNAVLVSSGRAWFDHTWNYNDADVQLTGDSADLLMDRWDAIVIDVDLSIANRQNQLLWVTGTAATNPVKPTMINTDDHKQYPLAYIYRNTNNDAITASDIHTTIGSDECPYVESILTDTKNIAQVEINDTASKSYTKGEYLLWNNLLYKTTVPISTGVAFVPYPEEGYNLTRTTVTDELFTTIIIDNTITAGSQHAVTSQAIYNALSTKFNTTGGTISGATTIAAALNVTGKTTLSGAADIYGATKVMNGTLTVSANGSTTSTILVGNTSSHAPGEIQLLSNGSTTNSNYYAIVLPQDAYTANRTFRLPNVSGTIGVVDQNAMNKNAITYGTGGKTAGTSALTTGYVYLQYE